MKIAVTGYAGNVGSRLIGMGCSPLPCDVTDAVEVEKSINSVKPDIIIHCAGKSGVDWCETNKKEAENVNWWGSNNVFEMSEKYSIPVVFISSDHIFSGDWFGSYQESSEDFKPKNHYGLTKFMGEASALAFNNVKIVRTSTLFWKSRYMVQRYLDLMERGKVVYPPFLIWRSFLHIDDFCKNLLIYADSFSEMPDILHLSGSKNISWFTFVKAWAKKMGKEDLVRPRLTDVTLPNEARRPLRAGLDTYLSEKLGFVQYSYLDGSNR